MLRNLNDRYVKVFGLLVLGVVSGPGWLAAATHSVEGKPLVLQSEARALNPKLIGKTVALFFVGGGTSRGVVKDMDADSITLQVNGEIHVYELGQIREIQVF